MHPTVCQLGPFTLSSYGLMLSLGFLLSIWLASRAAESLGAAVPMNKTAIADWACWAVLGGILGGRLFYVVMNWPDYAGSPLAGSVSTLGGTMPGNSKMNLSSPSVNRINAAESSSPISAISWLASFPRSRM